jgi:Cu2+-exporting ATPase
VLVVTCPCALSLAAPLAHSAAFACLARRGVLVLRGHALEALARATDFAFDKTGTLTHARMHIEEVVPCGAHGRDDVLALAARLEARVVHPIAQAIAMAGAAHEASAEPPTVAREVAGAGVEAVIAGRRVRIGSLDFAGALHGQPVPAALPSRLAGRTVAALADERGWIGIILLSAGLRPGAADLVAQLARSGCAVHLASGDASGPVAAAARALGIAQAHAQLSPAAKRALVQALQSRGRRVAMIGDGVNDAPVLAQADVAIAIGGGAPLAQTRADVVLSAGRPGDLAFAVTVARRTQTVVRQNLAWAAAYNLIAVPAAALGWVPPWLAGLGMALSSLLVALNAMRLAPPGSMTSVSSASASATPARGTVAPAPATA